MKILVTGGAGFIGSNFARMFAHGNLDGTNVSDELIILDSLTSESNLKNLDEIINNRNITFIQGEIGDADLLRTILINVDYVINFAAESHVDRSITDPSRFIKSNVLGMHNLISLSMELGVKRFIQISTDEVYGSIAQGSWDESSPILPNSPYAASKAAADCIARSYFKTFGYDVVVTRCSNNYGSHQHTEKVIPNFIQQVISGVNLTLYGDGKNSRDWLHVSDHCQAIWTVLRNGKPGEIYNIGGGLELTNLELAQKILSNFTNHTSRIDFVEDRKGHDFRYSVNYTKIRELGYSPKIEFELGLVETIDWYKSNLKDWRR
jgi:dTDP-glucose 4,6-dehydratase